VIYFDAAYIAKCYLNEPGADKVRRLAQDAAGLASCELGRLEFFCIVQRHVRESITPREARDVIADFTEDEDAGVWRWLPVTSSLVRDVCARVRGLPRTAFLRAGDALHLGCAREHGFREVYTNDQRMLAAARHFGLVGADVTEPD
jgi:predicted nucleic acid-binding protein